MSTYTARVFIENGFDETVELTPAECAQVAQIFMIARGRAIAEKIRRQQEAAARAKEQSDRLRNTIGGFANVGDAWRRRYANDPILTGLTHLRTPQRPRTPVTVSDALAVLRHYLPDADATLATRHLVRRAKRATHPDTGGTSPDFQLVTAAEAILRRNRFV